MTYISYRSTNYKKSKKPHVVHGSGSHKSVARKQTRYSLQDKESQRHIKESLLDYSLHKESGLSHMGSLEGNTIFDASLEDGGIATPEDIEKRLKEQDERYLEMIKTQKIVPGEWVKYGRKRAERA